MFAIEIEVRYTVQINKALSLLHHSTLKLSVHGGPCLEWNNLDWPKII